MAYREYIPHIALQPYVDAYWTGGNDTQHTFATTILPDGCVDMMVNLGEDYGEAMATLCCTGILTW